MREDCKALLRGLADLSKENLSFVRTWLAQLPTKPIEIRNYLTILEAAEDTGDEDKLEDQPCMLPCPSCKGIKEPGMTCIWCGGKGVVEANEAGDEPAVPYSKP